MAFIPGETGGTLVGLTSTAGSGIITSTNFGGIASLSSALVAGTNVALVPVPTFGGKGLRIDATPGTAGVNTLTVGSGLSNTGTAINPILNNTGVLSVSTTGSGSGITIGGTPANPQFSNAGVLGVNSQQGQVSLTSSGGSVTITNPTPGTINLEAPTGGGGTLTGITAGAGISVTPTNPAQPTIANTGILGLTAGTNVVLATPSPGTRSISVPNMPIPLQFSLSGGPGNFPIATNNVGFQSFNTLTSLGDLLVGIGAFTGVNTGFIVFDLNAYMLSMTSGQPGTIDLSFGTSGSPGPGLLAQTIQPSNPAAATTDISFPLGNLTLDMTAFRATYGSVPNNANLYVSLLNNNTNTVYANNRNTNYIAWYFPYLPI
jgi:hypothetical protein